MTTRHIATWSILALALFVTASHAAQSLLKNGSMENGLGADSPDPFAAAEWTESGENVERSAEANWIPTGEGFALKAFGDTVNTAAGASQSIACSPGDVVEVSWANYTRASDKLDGDAIAGVRVEFLGMFGNVISSAEDLGFDAASPADSWEIGQLTGLTAPAGTETVKIFCSLSWGTGTVLGSVYWDGVQVLINSTDAVLNGDFETAGVTGTSPTGIDDWNGFNDQVKSDAAADDGAYSLQIGTTEAFSGLYQNVGLVSGGDHLLLKARVLHPSSDPLTGDAIAGIKLEFSSATAPVPPVENIAIDDASPQDTWTSIEVSTTGLVIPDDITIARVVAIYVGGETSTGRVFFDSMAVHLNGNTGVNYLSNASFENGVGGPNGLDDWTEFNGDGSEAVKASFFDVAPHSGSFSCRMEGTAVAGVFQDIDLTAIGAGPGDTLDIAGYYHVKSSMPLVDATAGLKVEWVGGSVPPNVDIVGDPANPIILDSSSPTDTWVDVYIDYTMPAGTSANAQFTNLVGFAGPGTSGVAHFDSCEALVLNRFDGADADGDDDEDLSDFGQFQRCFSGSGVTPLAWNCTVFDSDDDGDVDLVDLDYFLPRLTGP